jgi:hypothetical protein
VPAGSEAVRPAVENPKPRTPPDAGSGPSRAGGTPLTAPASPPAAAEASEAGRRTARDLAQDDRGAKSGVESPGESARAPVSGTLPAGAPPGVGDSHREAATTSNSSSTPRAHATDQPDAPPATDRVTVHLPDEAGGGRIQISVRGETVHARIVGGDEMAARRLEDGLGELRGALARQGFQETHLRVDMAAPSDAGLAPAASELAGAGDSKQHDPETPERRERDRQQDGPRSDPRQQQHQGRSQQRARRERERQ